MILLHLHAFKVCLAFARESLRRISKHHGPPPKGCRGRFSGYFKDGMPCVKVETYGNPRWVPGIRMTA
jgi:hypothetical protein